ncbi:hypothetical protein ACFQE0_14425 [Methylobacterium komagatae]|uniref:Uncharacterized protein n=1 Tax=Methylobacterium komagatae TaxID=374425 RepID=A0ABW2BKU9_9HYPH
MKTSVQQMRGWGWRAGDGKDRWFLSGCTLPRTARRASGEAGSACCYAGISSSDRAPC